MDEQIKNAFEGNSKVINIDMEILPTITMEHICMLIYLRYYDNIRINLSETIEKGVYRICSKEEDYFQIRIKTDNIVILAMLYIIQYNGSLFSDFIDENHSRITGDDNEFYKIVQHFDVLHLCHTRSIISCLCIRTRRSNKTINAIENYFMTNNVKSARNV